MTNPKATDGDGVAEPDWSREERSPRVVERLAGVRGSWSRSTDVTDATLGAWS